jgi:3-dehydroquinate dehydratase I
MTWKPGQKRPGCADIAIPLVARNREELEEECRLLSGKPADLLEWRADYMIENGSPLAVADGMRLISSAFPSCPVLFTIRTAREGGLFTQSEETYAAWVKEAVEAGGAAVDLEYSLSDSVRDGLLAEAHRHDVSVVMSFHNFRETPPVEQMVSLFARMKESGADVGKIAVMPQAPADVLSLFSALLTIKKEYRDFPVIGISMGKLGRISRLAGSTFGSSVTFAAGAQASAPGQIDASALRHMLDMLEKD